MLLFLRPVFILLTVVLFVCGIGTVVEGMRYPTQEILEKHFPLSASINTLGSLIILGALPGFYGVISNSRMLIVIFLVAMVILLVANSLLTYKIWSINHDRALMRLTFKFRNFTNLYYEHKLIMEEMKNEFGRMAVLKTEEVRLLWPIHAGICSDPSGKATNCSGGLYPDRLRLLRSGDTGRLEHHDFAVQPLQWENAARVCTPNKASPSGCGKVLTEYQRAWVNSCLICLVLDASVQAMSAVLGVCVFLYKPKSLRIPVTE